MIPDLEAKRTRLARTGTRFYELYASTGSLPGSTATDAVYPPPVTLWQGIDLPTGQTAQAHGTVLVNYGDNPLLSALLSEVTELRQELAQLKQHIETQPATYSLLLSNLVDNEIRVIAPISVIIDESDSETTARWPNTRTFGIGATIGEALLALHVNIRDVFLDLTCREEADLGRIAKSTLRIFNAHLRVANERA